MPLLPKFALFVISINVIVLAQSSSVTAQSNGSNPEAAQLAQIPKSPATYILEPIETANAVYPAAAREQKIQREIEASILVSETGDVENVRFFKGDELLTSAAQEAMKKWKFKPVVVDGKPMAVGSKVTFNFVLSDDNQSAKGVLPNIAPATEFPKSVRVSAGVTQGLILSRVVPVYPSEAKASHIQGSVVLRGIINQEGKVVDLQPISGHPDLVPAAIEAVRQWRYRPYLLMGRPVAIDTQVTVIFTLSSR